MERQAQDFPGLVVTYLESAFGAQTQGRNQRTRSKFAFVIGMPPDGVVAVSIEIGQHAVAGKDPGGLDAVFQRQQIMRPGQRVMCYAGVAIVRCGDAVPGRQPGNTDTSASDEKRLLLPLEATHKDREPFAGHPGRQKAFVVVNFTISI